MKKTAIFVFIIFLSLNIAQALAQADEISLGDVQYSSPIEQVVILEPTLRPNKSYHMRCTVSNTGKAPLKVAFNILGEVPNIPIHYSLMPKPFRMLGEEVELEGYSAYQWEASPVLTQERVAFKVFNPQHWEHLKVSDCYAVSISKA